MFVLGFVEVFITGNITSCFLFSVYYECFVVQSFVYAVFRGLVKLVRLSWIPCVRGVYSLLERENRQSAGINSDLVRSCLFN